MQGHRRLCLRHRLPTKDPKIPRISRIPRTSRISRISIIIFAFPCDRSTISLNRMRYTFSTKPLESLLFLVIPVNCLPCLPVYLTSGHHVQLYDLLIGISKKSNVFKYPQEQTDYEKEFNCQGHTSFRRKYINMKATSRFFHPKKHNSLTSPRISPTRTRKLTMESFSHPAKMPSHTASQSKSGSSINKSTQHP